MPLATRAGKYRHRIIVQAITETRSDDGGVVRTWATETTRWGQVRPLQGKELFEQQQVDSRLTHRIEMRHVADLTPEKRLVHKGRTINIHSVVDVDEIERITVVMGIEDNT